MSDRRQTLLLGVTFFYWFASYTYVPILGPYAQTLGASFDMIGLILGSYGAVQLLLRVPIGLASDAWGRRRVFVIAGAGLSAASAFGLWFGTDPWALFFFRALSGAAAATWVGYTVLYASYYPAADGPKAMGFLNSAVFFAQVSAMFLGGLAAQWQGLAAPFLLAGLGGLAAVGLSLFVREEPRPPRPFNTDTLAALARDPAFLRVCLLGILFQILSFANVFGFAPVAAKNLGAGGFELGLLTTVAILPSIPASALSGTFFARRCGERGTLAGGFILMSLACFAVPAAQTMLFLYLTQTASGFGRGLIMPLLMALAIKDLPPDRRATAMGFYQAAYAVGMFAGPVLIGLVAGWFSLNTGFIVIGLIGLIGALISVRRYDDPTITPTQETRP